MVGGAAGDALGYAVEFEQLRQIKAQYGDRGITRYEPDDRGLAPISDDTQMALFTAAGVLLGMTRGYMRGIMGRLDSYCRFTYLDWLHTQEWRSRKEGARVDSWLMDVPELYARRAPGNTCITALKTLEAGKDVRNDSCGCGGVMRTAPVALISSLHRYGGGNLEHCDMVAAEVARITHRHPLGFLPSAVLNDILMQILDGKASDADSLRLVIQEASDRLPSIISEDDDSKTYGDLWPGDVARLQEILRQALDLARTGIPDVEAIERLGGGWTGHEALAIAVYSAVKHADSFEDAIVSAVNHSGDSDSTGAVCGNIVGCLLGRDAIPAYYTDKLELLDVIEEMANDLFTGCIIREYDRLDTPEKRRWSEKYVHHRRSAALVLRKLDESALSSLLLYRENDSHKGNYGHLLVVAGCQTMPGAAVLAAGAALRSGCGLVTLHSTERALQAAVTNYPSAMLSLDPGPCLSRVPDSLERYSAIAVGPGLGQKPETLAALKEILSAARRLGKPLVLDADALNLMAAHPELWDAVPAGSILTPHPGELRRILSWNTDAEKEAAARKFSQSRSCTLVLKGYHTRIYTPDGITLENLTGNPGMAKGGSGDVLTGLIGGLLARGYSAADAAALGVWIHGYAGDCLTAERTAEAYDAQDLIAYIWKGFKHLEN